MERRIVLVLLVGMMGFVCFGGQALAGLNPNAKAAVHVIPHDSRSCTKNFPAIGQCEDIIFTEPTADVDAFPVFFNLTEYQGFDYGMTWPGMYSCVFTSCSDLTIGAIVASGDGISHAWAECQDSSVAIPGWAWISDNGMVCVVPHPGAGGPNIGDCHAGPDSVPPDRRFCAGIGGYQGEDPCAEQPPVCEVIPLALDFGTITYGDPPVTRTFGIYNTGEADLEGVLSDDCADFNITDPAGGGAYLVAGGDSLVVTVEYDPSGAGQHQCNIGTDVLCDDVTCSGEALLPALCEVIPLTLDFGMIAYGDPPVTRTFGIYNTGEADLEGVLTEGCVDFNITDPGGGGAYLVAGGDSLVVTVEYDPTAAGQHQCDIDTDTPCDNVLCTGEAVIPVYVDIRPGACPNNLRPESPFVLPVAILGTANFDVRSVDAAAVRLTRDGVGAEVTPLRWAYNDVGTPFMGELCDCHALGGDGYEDLNLKFRISEVAAALELGAVAGETVELTLTGQLTPGALPIGPTIVGSDCVVVLSGLYGEEVPGPGIGFVTHTGGSPHTMLKLSFYTGTQDRVALEIFDVRGRLVKRLADQVMAPGIYEETWDRADDAGRQVPAGVYFARLRSSRQKETMKVLIVN